MTDWPKIISDLRYCGLTAKGIERLIGMKARTIYNIQSCHAAAPTGEDAAKLLALHADMQHILQSRVIKCSSPQPS